MQQVHPVSQRLETTAPVDGRALAAFTVDVEDWYQSSVDHDAPITPRVISNVRRITEVLEEQGVKATFFVQGRVAEAFPSLVQDLVALGHEIQAHGYSHRPLFAMDRRALYEELRRAKETVEDAGGVAVTAFRAQDFSILATNLWALELLAELGYTIDSSIFPMRTPRYGIARWELGPHRIGLSNAMSIVEVPVAIWNVGRWRVPVAGGGYFRMLPMGVLVRALRGIVAEGRPPIVYCHPYEFSPDELSAYRGAIPRSLYLSQRFGRRSFGQRVRGLMTHIRFGRFDEVLSAWGVT